MTRTFAGSDTTPRRGERASGWTEPLAQWEADAFDSSSGPEVDRDRWLHPSVVDHAVTGARRSTGVAAGGDTEGREQSDHDARTMPLFAVGTLHGNNGEPPPPRRRGRTRRDRLPRGVAIGLILLAVLVGIGPVILFASAHERDHDAKQHDRDHGHHKAKVTVTAPPATPSATASPTVSPTSTLTPGPGQPVYGVTNMEFDGPHAQPGQYAAGGPTNQALGGVDVLITWAGLEPNAPVNGVHTYNWAPYDNEVQTWVSHGKKVMIAVRYVSEFTKEGTLQGGNGQCSPNDEYLPSWAAGGAGFSVYCDADEGVFLPNFFSSTFINDLKTFEQAVAQHYAHSPWVSSIAYVRAGTGAAGEEIPNVHGPADPGPWNWLASVGYTNAAWRDWVEARLTEDKTYFSYTTVLNSVNVIGGAAKDPNPDPTTGQVGLSYQAEIAYWAAAHGLGVGVQALTPGLDYAGIRTIEQYISDHWPNTFREFQTWSGVGGTSEVTGDIQTAYCYAGGDRGLNPAGHIAIEWYKQDANNAAYLPLLESGAQMITTGAPPASGYCSGL